MTLRQLGRIAKHANKETLERIYPFLIKFMTEYEINTGERIAAFIPNLIHETGSFKYFKEIASGKDYDTGKLAKRLGNTPEADGDGQRFKGRGGIQITGRFNYEEVSKALGVDFVKNPELLETDEWAIRSACWWWKSRGLNELADKFMFTKIVKKITGGMNGIAERKAIYIVAQCELIK